MTISAVSPLSMSSIRPVGASLSGIEKRLSGFAFAMVNSATTKMAENAAASTAVQDKADNNKATMLDTNRGQSAVDLNNYFTVGQDIDFDDPAKCPPLLMPTLANIQALSEHASDLLQKMVSEAGISAPSSISYDAYGQIQLPADYPYADQFKSLLAENTVLARTLQTSHALTSAYAGMQESLPFTQAYTQAASQAERNALISQFAWLFDNDRPQPDIALHISRNASVTPSINGAALDLSASKTQQASAL